MRRPPLTRSPGGELAAWVDALGNDPADLRICVAIRPLVDLPWARMRWLAADWGNRRSLADNPDLAVDRSLGGIFIPLGRFRALVAAVDRAYVRHSPEPVPLALAIGWCPVLENGDAPALQRAAVAALLTTLSDVALTEPPSDTHRLMRWRPEMGESEIHLLLNGVDEALTLGTVPVPSHQVF